jgi:hypothetical protein
MLERHAESGLEIQKLEISLNWTGIPTDIPHSFTVLNPFAAGP